MFKKFAVIFTFATFLFFRFYKIPTSLFFFNEMGRDALVLQTWKTTHKPPLLGPQNSAIAFNQSPLYFYLLYPLFLITNGSPYSALLTNAIIYLLVFLLLVKFTLKSNYFWPLIASFFIISIHPQQIIQSRYIWNPSFCTAFLLLGFWSLILKKYYWAGLGFAASLAVSVSTFPTIILALFGFLPLIRKKILKPLLSLACWTFVYYSPILLFELTHNFLITKNILARGSTNQEGFSNFIQLMRIADYVFSLNITNLILLLVLCTLLILFAYKAKNKILLITASLFLCHVFFNVFFRITLEKHFIFGLVTLFALTVSFLPSKLRLISLMLITLNFLKNQNLSNYFSPAPRTYDQMLSCFQTICQQNPDPAYLSVTSSYHQFHNGPEHRYVGLKAGCNILNIEDNNQNSQTMFIVGDGAEYSSLKTDYYELGLFGRGKLTKTYSCQPNYKVYVLKK